MAISVKHNFVSNKADGTDASLLRPSNWNEDHNLELASGNLVGRMSAGSGAAEEIPISSAAATMLSKADIAAIVAYLGVSPPTTGDGWITLKTTAPSGWVMMNDGTIGDASSGAGRANIDTQDLFTLIYNNVLDANAPVLTSTGAATTRAVQGTAAAAWAAHCRLSLTKQLGRAIIVAGTGGGLTARALGSVGGEENHTLTAAEIPQITSGGGGSISGTTDNGNVLLGSNFVGAGLAGGGNTVYVPNTGGGPPQAAQIHVSGSASVSTTSNNTGGGAHNNMQPWAAWNVMVKL